METESWYLDKKCSQYTWKCKKCDQMAELSKKESEARHMTTSQMEDGNVTPWLHGQRSATFWKNLNMRVARKCEEHLRPSRRARTI